MFDYVLTGPISGPFGGQYLAGLLNELFAYFHAGIVLPEIRRRVFFAVMLRSISGRNIKGTGSATRRCGFMQVTT